MGEGLSLKHIFRGHWRVVTRNQCLHPPVCGPGVARPGWRLFLESMVVGTARKGDLGLLRWGESSEDLLASAGGQRGEAGGGATG